MPPALRLFFLAIVLWANIAKAQSPISWLWGNEPGDANRALEIMTKDPSWIKRRDSDRRTPLHAAARFGHAEVVRWLLENGADVDAQCYNDFTPLHLTSDIAVVRLILARDPDLSIRSMSGTALQSVIQKMQRAEGIRKQRLQQIVDLYILHDKNIDIISASSLGRLERSKQIFAANPEFAHRYYGVTPLREAAKAGQLELCRYLIEKHQVDINDFEGGTGYPIIKSALNYPEIVKLLLSHDVDLDRRITWQGSRTGYWIIGDDATVLHYAAAHGAPETITQLLDAGVPFLVNTVDAFKRQANNQTALDVAAVFARADNVESLLAHSKYLEAVKQEKGLLNRALVKAVRPLSPFSHGRKQNPSNIVKLLIAAGADPKAIEDGQNLIQLAASLVRQGEVESNDHLLEIAKIIHDAGVEIDLYSAVAFNSLSQTRRILKQDKNQANARRRDGYPALHFAIAMNRKELVNMLLAAGADIQLRNESTSYGGVGTSPLHVAEFFGRLDIAKLLLDRGADINAVDDNGDTPLHSASFHNDIPVARFLVENGADQNIKNLTGKSALEVVRMRNWKMKQYLGSESRAK